MQIVETIDEQAARWVARIDSGKLKAEEDPLLQAWLQADARHQGAYIRARARWVDFDRLAALHGTSDPPVEEIGPRRGISRRQLLVAASVAGIAIVGGGFSWLALRRDEVRYATEIGEVRRVALVDGSTLILNTASEVTASFGKRQRALRLVRGEALFEVAHDKARPFTVYAHRSTVRAVGTAFAIRLEPTQLDVTVTEGVVELESATASGEGAASGG